MNISALHKVKNNRCLANSYNPLGTFHSVGDTTDICGYLRYTLVFHLKSNITSMFRDRVCEGKTIPSRRTLEHIYLSLRH